MRSLASRFGAALLVFALVTLLTVGGALWVALRDLHRDAALGALAELTVPYASQARQRFPLELLGPARGRHSDDDLRAYRESREGRLASDAFEEFVQQAQDEIEAAGISVLLVSDGGTVVRDPSTGAIGTLAAAPSIVDPPPAGGGDGHHDLDGLGQVVYAATPIRDPLADRSVPTLVLVRTDDSAAWPPPTLSGRWRLPASCSSSSASRWPSGLSRSVDGPLRRLAAASGTVAAGGVPEPLPTGGPVEVAEASAAFNVMAAEVEATRQAQRQLLADVRHDLRTPLTVIGGFAEALRDGTARGASAERAATAISDEAGRLERMLADLDHLAMPGTESPALRLEPLRGWSWPRPPSSASHRRPIRAASPWGLPRRPRAPAAPPSSATGMRWTASSATSWPTPCSTHPRPEATCGSRYARSRPLTVRSADLAAGADGPASCWRSATTGPGSHRRPSPTSSTASTALTRRAPPAVLASGWPSSVTSPMRSAAASSPRTCPVAEHASGSSCRWSSPRTGGCRTPPARGLRPRQATVPRGARSTRRGTVSVPPLAILLAGRSRRAHYPAAGHPLL